MQKLFYLPCFLHEFCHYLAARLLGHQATMAVDHVVVDGPLPVWKDILITLAPAVFGLILFGGHVALYWTEGRFWMAAAMGVAGVAWQLGCWYDFADLMRMVRP